MKLHFLGYRLKPARAVLLVSLITATSLALMNLSGAQATTASLQADYHPHARAQSNTAVGWLSEDHQPGKVIAMSASPTPAVAEDDPGVAGSSAIAGSNSVSTPLPIPPKPTIAVPPTNAPPAEDPIQPPTVTFPPDAMPPSPIQKYPAPTPIYGPINGCVAPGPPGTMHPDYCIVMDN